MATSDLIISTKKELAEVDKNLEEIETQIQLLLNKQSALQKRRSFLKKHLELQSENKKSSHDWSSESFDWSTTLRSKCNSVFGIQSFRPNQLETINTTMSGLDCILVLPTGAGKSLCYQLPALFDKGYTLVISPLVSLMEDQVMALEKRGVLATMLQADSPKETVTAVYADVTRQPCKLRLLYVTPEKLAKSKRFMNKLEQSYKAGLLSRIAIDEVHCCSQWGHDFRPDYKFLGILKKQFPKVPILGLTATASAGVLVDVQKMLHLTHAQIYKGSFNRKNLHYSVMAKPLTHDECMDTLADMINARFHKQSGIVYCFSRKDTETIAGDLNSRGVRSAPYHAYLDRELRSQTHSRWLEGKVEVIVATIAFGMGIDKPDVRFVIHHSLSKSMENYYQESGRAGRDGLRADCILMYRLANVYKQSCMVFAETTGLEKLYAMVKYCIAQSTCRRALMAEHFSEVWDDTGCGSACDLCQGCRGVTLESSSADCTVQLIYGILDKASRMDTRLTGQKLIEAVMGKGSTQHRMKTASSLNRDRCEFLLGNMLIDGLIREDFHFTPYSTISYIVIGNRKSTLNSNYVESLNTRSPSEKACADARISSVKGVKRSSHNRSETTVKKEKVKVAKKPLVPTASRDEADVIVLSD
ncbi:ATP-dependent DNA helicase Q1-like [Watersipora subatra]|uniref:ATP-dependent DNA helicase Q1-like n=1 Tax=Watersipora subatra TaxID=2589382 RepID=UPI00355C62CC